MAARLNRSAGFVAVTAMLVLFMAAAGAPTPLYVVYQQQWGFPTSTLTLVFAVYVLGLLATILVVGALSDHVGRRPVLVAAIALEAVALLLFLTAGGVGTLLAARLVQGVATGAAITTLSAAVVDLAAPSRTGRAGLVTSVATLLGLAAGSVGTGALVEFAPAPTHARLRRAAGRRPARRRGDGAAARDRTSAPRRAGLPAAARRHARLPAVRVPVDHADPAGQLGARRPVPLARPVRGRELAGHHRPPRRRPGGHVALRHRRAHRAGAAQLAAAAGGAAGRRPARGGHRWAPSRPSTRARRRSPRSARSSRGSVSAPRASARSAPWPRWPARPSGARCSRSIYVVSYLAFSVPAVAAGVAANVVGLGPTTTVYGGVVAALGLVAVAARLRVRESARNSGARPRSPIGR